MLPLAEWDLHRAQPHRSSNWEISCWSQWESNTQNLGNAGIKTACAVLILPPCACARWYNLQITWSQTIFPTGLLHRSVQRMDSDHRIGSYSVFCVILTVQCVVSPTHIYGILSNFTLKRGLLTSWALLWCSSLPHWFSVPVSCPVSRNLPCQLQVLFPLFPCTSLQSESSPPRHPRLLFPIYSSYLWSGSHPLSIWIRELSPPCCLGWGRRHSLPALS